VPPLHLRPADVRALRLRAQHLTDAAAASTMLEAAAVGLQDTPPGSATIGVAARMRSATPAAVRRALADDRTLAIAWTRRGSPHLVPAAELGLFTRGLLPDDDESWRATIAGFVVHLDSANMTAEELVRLVAGAVHEVLDGRELTKRELGEAIRPLMPAPLRIWFDPDTFSRFTAMLTRAASLFGGFVIAPRHGAELSFVRTDQWLGAAPDDDPARARIEMARRYLSLYGPSLPRAYAEWAGIGEGHARRAFDALASETVAVRVEGADGLLLAEDAERVGTIEPAAGVRLLAPHDAYVASMDRRVIVPEQTHHKALWKAQGNPGAVLVDDEIAGVWRTRVQGKTMVLEVTEFRTLPVRARKAIEVEAARLAPFKGARGARVLI